MLKPKIKRAPKKAPVKNRRAGAPHPKAAGVISLGPADSRKFMDMLSRPARGPNAFVRDALADYHRLLGDK
jgi:hypothetical protein